MGYTPLTREQYQKAISAGFAPDKIITMEKQRKAQATPTPAPAPAPQGFLSRVGSDFMNRGQQVVNDATKSYGEVGSYSGSKGFDAPLLAARTAGRTAGQVAGMAGDIIGEAIPQFAKNAAGSAVGAIAGTGVGQAIAGAGKAAYNAIPDGIKPDVASVANTLSLLGGGKAASAAVPTIDRASMGLAKGLATGAEKSTSALKNRGLIKTISSIAGDEKTMGKVERLAAQNEGRLQPTVLGGKKFIASETEKRAGELLHGKLTKNAVKDVPIIKQEIASRGRAVENFLNKASKPISNQEDFAAFQKFVTKNSKYMDEAEIGAYKAQLGMFQNILKDYGEYSTKNYYLALKEYEQNIAEKLPRGQQALIDGVGSAKVQAASDIRKTVRDMIGGKHPEFQPRMFDLASLYDVKHTVMTKADQIKGNILTRAGKAIQKNPVTSLFAGVAIDKTLKATMGIGY